jgi:hypothetical protein
MKKPIRLAFCDFEINWGPWPNPVKYFTDLLSEEYDISIVYSDFVGQKADFPVPPELAICAVPGRKHEQFKCPKIYFPGEPYPVNLVEYQYAMTHHFSPDPRHHRLPLYALYGDVNKLTTPKCFSAAPPVKQREFCCVLFGKSYPFDETPREAFFHELCKYKKVHSAGRHLNNMDFVIPPEKKAQFIQQYKFVLSFESCSLPGFTTEKVFEPLLMNTVPVYWGNSLVGRDFDTKAFVNCRDYENLDQVIERIIELDTNEEAYREVWNQPAYVDNTVNEFVKRENILSFFRGITG